MITVAYFWMRKIIGKGAEEKWKHLLPSNLATNLATNLANLILKLFVYSAPFPEYKLKGIVYKN